MKNEETSFVSLTFPKNLLMLLLPYSGLRLHKQYHPRHTFSTTLVLPSFYTKKHLRKYLRNLKKNGEQQQKSPVSKQE